MPGVTTTRDAPGTKPEAAPGNPEAVGIMIGPPPPSCCGSRGRPRGHGADLCVTSLNLGGRNTNMLEFELKGDSSEIGLRATAMLSRTCQALQDVREGPLAMPSAERALIAEIAAEISSDWPSRPSEAAHLAQTQGLFQCHSWASVLASVKADQPYLFNALNLQTLKLNRPSVWENPSSCHSLTNTLEYLVAWQHWFRTLDRVGSFWLQEAPHAAAKRNLDVAVCFLGLLIFDVMCLCVARSAFREEPLDDSRDDDDDDDDDGRQVPFGEIAELARRSPASNIVVRHRIANSFVQNIGAHVIFAQEARNFADDPGIAEDFLPPFYAADGFTAVFLRRAAFGNVVDLSEVVSEKMQGQVDSESPCRVQRAWHTTAKRLAVVKCECDSLRVCLVSLHCAESVGVTEFLESLRALLREYHADLNIVGMDANCQGKESVAFRQQLRSSGFDIGSQQDQVTVSKQRTYIQTQVRKAGAADISHKDYIVSWGSTKLHRGKTAYSPDLGTAYGVEQETKQCIRLPNTSWPFDHCSVATSFAMKHGFRVSLPRRPETICRCAFVGVVLLLLLSPLMSPSRDHPLGAPGSWYRETWPSDARVGLCEGQLPCADGWTHHAGSCYLATPPLVHEQADRFCRERGGSSLASIGSEAENEFLTLDLCPRGDLCWIGLHSDRARGEVWWASGEPLNYSRLVLEQAQASPLVVVPGSQKTDRAAGVLSALPRGMSGCGASEFLILLEDVPENLRLLRLVGIGLTLLVSTVTLALPRPASRLTTFYLLLSFVMKLGWYLSHVRAACFAASFQELASSSRLSAVIFESGGLSLTANFAAWIILKRMTVLYPAKMPRATFKLLIVSWLVWGLTNLLLIDYSTTLSAEAIPVLSVFVLKVIIILLHVVLCAPIAYNLYGTLAFMTREATLGCSRETELAGLSNQVRAAKVHLLCVSAAIVTGALRWSAQLAWFWCVVRLEDIFRLDPVAVSAIFADAITNDLCAYILVAMHMDETLVRARGITAGVAMRARLEVAQHEVAVRTLTAAPTSQEQLQHLAQLEAKARAALLDGGGAGGAGGAEEPSFLALKAAVHVESCRIHQLMRCVCVRAMTMPLRYQHLMEIPALHGRPKQPVPEGLAEAPASGGGYFDWLYAEADAVRLAFFRQVGYHVAVFNRAVWPSDLGLATEQFPWKISAKEVGTSPGGVVSPGDLLTHGQRRRTLLGRSFTSGTLCYALEERGDRAKVHLSGFEQPVEVPCEELRRCPGGAVFVPGPKKERQRCLDKIAADYEGREEGSGAAAAGLLDICRCMIVLDDPYAIAVFVAYLRKEMRMVRIKNRFSDDVLESVGPEELLAMFYDSSNAFHDQAASGSSSPSSSATTSFSPHQYRCVHINLEVLGPSGLPFVCELQVTLSSVAVLKSEDTKLYTISRMRTAEELRSVIVFAAQPETAASEGE